MKPTHQILIKSLILINTIMLLFFFLSPSFANQASTELVTEGRDILFNNIHSDNPTYSAFLSANSKFQAALEEDPTDPEANLFCAVTRFAAFFLGQGDGSDPETFMDLAGIFGMPRTDNDYLNDGPPFEETELYDHTYFDDSVPGGKAIRDFLAEKFIGAIDASMNNLSAIQTSFGMTLLPQETGDISIEVDYGDVLLLKSFLYTLKAALHILTAYNLDIDIHRLSVLLNGRVFRFQRDLLDEYPQLFHLMPDGGGSQSLSTARQALINGINSSNEAFDFITAEGDDQGNDLFYFGSEEDQNEAESLLLYMNEVRDSLNENRIAEITRTSETWILTDALSNRVQMEITKDMTGAFESGYAYGLDGCGFLFCSGGIKSYEVSGTDITIHMASNWWCGEIDYTLTGQLSGGQILNGEYSFTDCNNNTQNGIFTGQRDSFSEEADRMDLNKIFGNTGKSPLDLRAVMPQFYKRSSIVPGTFPDPVLNGVFPDITTNEALTQELDLEPVSTDVVSISGEISCPAHNGTGNIFIHAFNGPDYRTASLLSAGYITSPGPYELKGLHPGMHVFLFARWDKDDNGILTFGDFGGYGGDYIVPEEGLKNINFSADQEIDDNRMMTKPGLYRLFGSNTFDIPQNYQGPWDPNKVNWGDGWTFIGESDRTETFTTDQFYETLLIIWHSNSIFNFDSVEDLVSGTAFAEDEYGNPSGYSWISSDLRNYDSDEWTEPYYFKGHPDRLYANTADWYGLSLFSMPLDSVDPNSPRQLKITLLSNKAGDMNGDNEVDLKDVITILKAVVGLTPDDLYPNIYSDSRIGLEEAIETIQIIAGLRE